ncbi:hypothetical protein BDV23DRAFT_163740 [Aspergillus alliaceus]|uniref:LysM domain-containing protein n=1 Tax=Petromyces alliaceus TaxID=209559 RepID=A0A5N7BX27_PETAA|nr:hypothetical protein BDV23DRAFT_163740 [Aspergillus alliaceus]
MGLRLFLVLGLLLQLLSAHRLYTRQSVTCEFSVAAAHDGQTCDSFTTMWGINPSKFLSLNPGLDCSGLSGDHLYCLKGSVLSVSPTSMEMTSSTAASPTISSTTTGSSTATSSTATGSTTTTSSTATGNSTATKETTTPTASTQSAATALSIPLEITIIITLLLFLCSI